MDLLSMPRLGQTMDAGVLVARHVDSGATYAAGDPLYTVETEKVETEIEAKTDGRMLRWLADEGDEIAVGAPIAVLGDRSEEPDAASIDRFLDGGSPPAGDAGPATGHLPPPTPVRGDPSQQIRAMPKARALAKEHNLDLAVIAADNSRGPGPVTVADVEAYLARRTSTTVLPPSPQVGAQPVRLDGHRRAMVASMATSWSTIPHFTELVEVDTTALLDERSRYDGPGRRPTVTAYLIRAFARACRAVPMIHAGLVDGGMVEREQVDMAVAVDTPQGLVAPVMRGVDRLDVVEIAERLTDLATRARERRLTIADVEGGQVALSNLGVYGVHAGAPIIPPNQTAMLFAGSIVERAVVIGGAIVARPMMWLSLTCDHRLIDGATAARVLQVVRSGIEATDPD